MLHGQSHSRRKMPEVTEEEPAVDLEPQVAGAPVTPCDGCRHHNRCLANSIACEAAALYARFGSRPLAKVQRWSYASRQPNAEIFERIRIAPPLVSADEQRRRREAMAVTLAREAAESSSERNAGSFGQKMVRL